MCQAKNKYITPLADGNNDIIIPDGFVKNYNASPLLDVVLSDFNRPQEFAELLKHHLKSDKKRQKKLRKWALNCREDEYQNRRFFLKELIKGIQAGLPNGRNNEKNDD